MKTLKNILYTQVLLVFVFTTIAPVAFAQEVSSTEPAFFHDINYYAPEYAKSKNVQENLHLQNIHPVIIGLNNKFDMDAHLREPKEPSFFSKALHFFRNKHQKETEQVKEAEETLHSTAVHDNDIYDRAYDKMNSAN